MENLLVIDGNDDTASALEKHLPKEKYNIHLADSAKALDHIEEFKDFNLIIFDAHLNDTPGLVNKLKEAYPGLPVIVVSNDDNFRSAVEWMKQGASDYLLKPFSKEEINSSVTEAVQPGNSFISAQKDGVSDKEYSLFENEKYIAGKSKVFDHIIRQTNIVAPTDYSVIIYGESGSGKEAIAREIHKKSNRKNFPFIAIDCGALSKELAGSELFGHEKGSFTGAIVRKTGSFELANKGTLFLDEVANLPYDVQVSLLRVVQERKMRRIGGTVDILLDVRIIIASNENLQLASGKGQFREDLFHRFNEFTIVIPPLKERKEDIPVFAKHFLDDANESLRKNITGFSEEVMNAFTRYSWPGNLRELRNVVRRAALLAEDHHLIDANCLPLEINEFYKLHQPMEEKKPVFFSTPPTGNGDGKSGLAGNTLKTAMVDMEYQLILKTLAKCNFNKSKAAKMLKIDRRTLYNKMKQYRDLNEKARND